MLDDFSKSDTSDFGPFGPWAYMAQFADLFPSDDEDEVELERSDEDTEVFEANEVLDYPEEGDDENDDDGYWYDPRFDGIDSDFIGDQDLYGGECDEGRDDYP